MGVASLSRARLSGYDVVRAVIPGVVAALLTGISTKNAEAKIPTPTLPPPETYTVTSASDIGAGTLHDAITQANAHSGADFIHFDIDPGGVQFLTPNNGLPQITDSVTIDGTTQPGYAGTPLIVIDGTTQDGGSGLVVQTTENVTIKGLLIRNFDYYGIGISESSEVLVTDCYLGTGVNGTNAQPNGYYGIYMWNCTQVIIAGETDDTGNLISGNGKSGIMIDGGCVSVLIQRNRIGTDLTGTSALPNGEHGIIVNDGTAIKIGDPAVAEVPEKGNIIAFNTLDGVFVGEDSTGVNIRGNSIFSNGETGIDLYPDGPAKNDVHDEDTGANEQQNLPVINEVRFDKAANAIVGFLGSKPDSSYKIDVYSDTSVACTIENSAEGKEFVTSGTIETGNDGMAGFDLAIIGRVPVAGDYLTCTATDSQGNTSEFPQACFEVQPSTTPTPTPTPVLPPGWDVGDFDDTGCTDLQDFLFVIDNWQVEVQGHMMDLGMFLTLLDHWQEGC